MVSPRALSIISRSSPLRPVIAYCLALAGLKRHMQSNHKEDLDESIFYFSESILHPSHTWLENGTTIFNTLLNLARALLRRTIVSKQPEDAIYAAKYLRYLRDQPHQLHQFPCYRVTGLLVEALAYQVKWGVENTMQNIGEMAALCQELLTSNISDDSITRAITVFARAALEQLRPWVLDQPLDQAIECLRVARKHRPDRREARFVLSWSLCCCCLTFVSDDYEEAVSILDEIITCSVPGDSQDEFVDMARHLVTSLMICRSYSGGTPEYLEEAIRRARSYLDSLSVEERPHSHFAFVFLEEATRQRLRHLGSTETLAPSSCDSQHFQPVPGPSFSENKYLELYRMGRRMELLVSVIQNSTDKMKVDEAIEEGRSLLSSSSPKEPLAQHLFYSFSKMLFKAFESTNNMEYLNESITACRQSLERPLPPAMRFGSLFQLCVSLSTRATSFPDHCAQDMEEFLKLLPQCINDRLPSFPERFRMACLWALHARRIRHPSVSTAYETAVSLIQDTLLVIPTLQLQHASLTEVSDVSYRMPLDYASYQIDLQKFEEAIEILEKGRALLWSEMRNLRLSIDQLLKADPDLGHAFASVNQDLEELTKSIPPTHRLSMGGGVPDGLTAVDPFGRLLLKQCRLSKERDRLISQIKALPGFDSFPKSPSYDMLRSAASSGPVIIINHSFWRSDILILLPNTSPSHIPTPSNFYHRAKALKDDLLDARSRHGPDSHRYNQTLAHVLTELYNLVGKPVIDRLGQLNVPEQSRIWWCPTSVFCSLPLHAMGPIPSDDGVEGRYFLDIYISSYTPTLSALIHDSEPRDSESPTLALPSLLLVAHFDVPSPDVPVSEVCEDIKVVQQLKTRLSVKSLILEEATPSSALDNLRDHQFVHFVCHGTLEDRKPFEAGFELHASERLTLLDIVRTRLPAAEFAFLSACHTAELTDGSSADEGLHLAAAMQYCGFRSVVGTMWAMANEDGPDLAKYFYKSMFPKEDKGESVPHYKRSAGALRDAVKKLRKTRGVTLERWVNFIHYGA